MYWIGNERQSERKGGADYGCIWSVVCVVSLDDWWWRRWSTGTALSSVLRHRNRMTRQMWIAQIVSSSTEWVPWVRGNSTQAIYRFNQRSKLAIIESWRTKIHVVTKKNYGLGILHGTERDRIPWTKTSRIDPAMPPAPSNVTVWSLTTLLSNRMVMYGRTAHAYTRSTYIGTHYNEQKEFVDLSIRFRRCETTVRQCQNVKLDFFWYRKIFETYPLFCRSKWKFCNMNNPRDFIR